MLTHASHTRSRDAGFTLPELLITMTILGVITIPLAQVVMSYFFNAEKIRARQTESKDQQLASQFWSRDVSSVGLRDAAFGLSSGINTGSPCGTTPAGGAAEISFRWTAFTFIAPSTAATPDTASVTYYSIPPTATAGGRLVRISCISGTPKATTIANTLRTDAAHPIQCSTDGSTFVACPDLSGTGANGVFLKFYVADASNKGQPYWTTISGQRRQTS